MKHKLKVAYIVGEKIGFTAIGQNTQRRKAVLESVGAKVELVVHDENSSFWTQLLSLINNPIDGVIYIRLDGSGELEKFSIIKLFKKVRVVWEIHGFPEERLWSQTTFWLKLMVAKDKIKRFLLSVLVDDYIFISNQLKRHARCKLLLADRHQWIISNFLDDNTHQESTLTNLLETNSLFKVIWSGDGWYQWHDLEKLQLVAQNVYQRDQNVIFILIGSNIATRLTWFKNILVIPALPPDEYLSLVLESDLALVLYRSLDCCPFYFSPLKVIDFLSCSVPLLISDHVFKNLGLTNDFAIKAEKSAPSIATQILETKRHKAKLNRMSLAAQNFFSDHYNQKLARQKYQQIVETWQRK